MLQDLPTPLRWAATDAVSGRQVVLTRARHRATEACLPALWAMVDDVRKAYEQGIGQKVHGARFFKVHGSAPADEQALQPGQEAALRRPGHSKSEAPCVEFEPKIPSRSRRGMGGPDR